MNHRYIHSTPEINAIIRFGRHQMVLARSVFTAASMLYQKTWVVAREGAVLYFTKLWHMNQLDSRNILIQLQNLLQFEGNDEMWIQHVLGYAHHQILFRPTRCLLPPIGLASWHEPPPLLPTESPCPWYAFLVAPQARLAVCTLPVTFQALRLSSPAPPWVHRP